MAHLEANNILSPTQSDYRKHRSTEDQLALLAQEIENFFQEKKKKRLWQYSTTYPKLWREGLLFKVLQAGVSGRMYTWIRCILHDRSPRVKVDGHFSDSVKMREGVPQGGGGGFANTLPRLYQQHHHWYPKTCLQHTP